MKNDDLQMMRRAIDATTSNGNGSASGPVEASEEDGFDANEYVRQLIQRMGGDDKSSSAVPASAPQPPAKNPEPPKKSPPVAVPPRRMTRAEEMGIELEPAGAAARRKLETLVDFEKLREAANITSSSDLHRSDCNSLVRRAYYHLVLSILCMVLSLVLLSLSTGVFSKAHLACVGLLVLATTFTFRYTATSRVLWSKMNPRSKRMAGAGI